LFGLMVSYLVIYKKPQTTMKFKRRHGEFEQGCVLSESYTATDALPPILQACRQPLLPACVFVTRDTIRHPRRFCSENLFVNRFRDERRSWTEVPLYVFVALGFQQALRMLHIFICRFRSTTYCHINQVFRKTVTENQNVCFDFHHNFRLNQFSFW
jgi:hypothetical protein